jgi:amino acid adenylation domain-containing protein
MLDRSDGPSLRSGFIHNVCKNPDRIAVVVRDKAYTYEELDVRARKWAGTLTSDGGTRPERVAIFAYRSDVAYAGTLAALYAGATYVPLNPTFPIEKTASMLEQADVDAVIVDKACLAQAQQVLGTSPRVPVLVPEFERSNLPFDGGTIFDGPVLEDADPLQHDRLPPLTPDDVAYLLFTSGSTGVPKGVPVTHGNAFYFIDAMSRRYGIAPVDRFSQTFDQTFDLSVFDLFMAWTNGASVYAMSPVDLLSPTKFISRNQITVWFSVPSVAAQMRRRNTLRPDSLPSLRWSLFCGEPLPEESADAWQAAAPNSIVENLYGPTELTIACFAYRWKSNVSRRLCRNGVVPIGRPYEGLAALVVDENLSPVSDGNTGELCVSGPQTTPGYWRSPGKTAERYVELPISRHETRRFYRTGDLVARTATGDYVFLGRADSQIKVLGHRVELGEIEAVLRSHPRVEHAAAFGSPMTGISAEAIVAFVSGDDLNLDEIFELAKANLPPYVVPRRIVPLAMMPLNANGKVDRRNLQNRLNELEPQPA